ncbi:REP-associated tyrosine transposase [Bradyrhizobium sp. USDA 4451]
MVQYRRNFIPGGTFFFTVTLEDRTSSLLVEHVGLLRAAFRAARAKKPFTLDAIAVLPDHLHTVMTLPPVDSDFPDRWRQIKSLFTRAVVASGVPLSANRRGEYPLWQRRFWEHTIRNERDLERCVDYVHYNPTKHRLVSSPADWQHTSLHRYIRNGTLPPDWGGSGAMDNSDFGERKD